VMTRPIPMSHLRPIRSDAQAPNMLPIMVLGRQMCQSCAARLFVVFSSNLRCDRSPADGALPDSVKNIVLLERMTKVFSELGDSENDTRGETFEAG
jgi:hypothetical protein